MHPGIEELAELVQKLFPDKKLPVLTAETKIKAELCFDSLEILLLAISLSEKYNLRPEDLGSAETIGDLCRCMTLKTD